MYLGIDTGQSSSVHFKSQRANGPTMGDYKGNQFLMETGYTRGHSVPCVFFVEKLRKLLRMAVALC